MGLEHKACRTGTLYRDISERTYRLLHLALCTTKYIPDMKQRSEQVRILFTSYHDFESSFPSRLFWMLPIAFRCFRSLSPFFSFLYGGILCILCILSAFDLAVLLSWTAAQPRRRIHEQRSVLDIVDSENFMGEKFPGSDFLRGVAVR